MYFYFSHLQNSGMNMSISRENGLQNDWKSTYKNGSRQFFWQNFWRSGAFNGGEGHLERGLTSKVVQNVPLSATDNWVKAISLPKGCQVLGVQKGRNLSIQKVH